MTHVLNSGIITVPIVIAAGLEFHAIRGYVCGCESV